MKIEFDNLSKSGLRELGRVIRAETAFRRSGQEPRTLINAIAAEWECGDCANTGEECYGCPFYIASQRVITDLWEMAARRVTRI
jgi:hypothetical protein